MFKQRRKKKNRDGKGDCVESQGWLVNHRSRHALESHGNGKVGMEGNGSRTSKGDLASVAIVCQTAQRWMAMTGET